VPGSEEISVAEIEAIQSRLRDRYRPREGETWMAAAEAAGKLSARAVVLLSDIGRSRARFDTDRLNRDQLEQLVGLLEAIIDDAR
jgi:hypothetical protein